MFNDECFGNQEISQPSFISRKATLIGRVIVEENVMISPNASIRADEGSPFKICKGTNIQDEVVMHGLLGKFVEVEGEKYSIYICSHCSIAHGALIHGPTKISKKTFIGFRAIIHNSQIGRNCFIGHGTIIEGVVIPDGRYVANGRIIDHQRAADELPSVPESKKEFNKEVVDYNKALVQRYLTRREKKDLFSVSGK